MQGENISEYSVDIEGGKGVSVEKINRADSPNYLFIDVDIAENAAPGTYYIVFTGNGVSFKYPYVIQAREEGSAERKSFTTADMIYLIMPDRFANGDTGNDSTDDTSDKCAREELFGRHGGDIQGIIDNLDYISELGATAIWCTPLLEDNQPEHSYHGYACTDYYRIDPRFGTNDLFKEYVSKAHEKGLKIIMDIVPNHAGSAHWWMEDTPFKDWYHIFDTYTGSNICFSSNNDYNASKADLYYHESGWFDKSMVDMNLDNPFVLKYFQQWAIWWIEYADLDGLRVDTYPYIEKVPGSQWVAAIRNEYPNMNIVGECWTRPAPAVAYWQSGVKNFDGFDSNLPTVMDFPTEEAIRQALENDGKGWGNGLTRVYDALTMDYLYADVNKLLTFLGNHDMARITDVVKDKDLRRVKLAYVLLATMRGIPQVLYGDEYAMTSAGEDPSNHSYLRAPLPQGDEVTAEMQDMFDFQSKLFQWRKNEPVLHTGKTMHFLTRDNTYAFFRYDKESAVFVFANASDQVRVAPTENYAEILSQYNPVGINPLTGETVDLRRADVAAPALSTIVVKLHK